MSFLLRNLFVARSYDSLEGCQRTNLESEYPGNCIQNRIGNVSINPLKIAQLRSNWGVLLWKVGSLYFSLCAIYHSWWCVDHLFGTHRYNNLPTKPRLSSIYFCTQGILMNEVVEQGTPLLLFTFILYVTSFIIYFILSYSILFYM